MTERAEQSKLLLMSRLARLMLVLCLILSFLPSCSAKNFINNKIDIPEMARLVVDSLQDLTVSETLFKRIPEEQRDGLSYSEYYEYISILRKMMPEGSRVRSFDIVEGTEREDLISQMAGTDPDLYEELNSYCIPVRVTTTGSRKSGVPVYFYLQTGKDGTVYLSHDWIRSCVDLYAFSVHYFETYTYESVGDVVSLLRHTPVSSDLLSSDKVMEEKAKEMIRFYSTNVKSAFSEYELVSIDASDLVYLQPAVLDTKFQSHPRQVRFKSDVNNVISVDDPLTSELKSADLYLYFGGHRTIRIGESATLSQLQSLFGDPISVSCGPVVETLMDSEGKILQYRNILIRYNGFSITVYGTYTDEEDWEGSYVRFRIWSSSRVAVGMSMKINNTSWDILERYPFADATSYTLTNTIDGEQYELVFEMEDDSSDEQGRSIKEIRLSWIR